MIDDIIFNEIMDMETDEDFDIDYIRDELN